MFVFDHRFATCNSINLTPICNELCKARQKVGSLFPDAIEILCIDSFGVAGANPGIKTSQIFKLRTSLLLIHVQLPE